MKFRSRTDVYNILMIVLIIGILALPNFVFEFSWVYLTIMLEFDFLMVWFIFSTTYKLSNNGIIVSSGFISFEIDYNSIKEIKFVKVFYRSTCSNAIKSIEISYGSNRKSVPNKVCISPVNENQFLSELKKHCKIKF